MLKLFKLRSWLLIFLLSFSLSCLQLNTENGESTLALKQKITTEYKDSIRSVLEITNQEKTILQVIFENSNISELQKNEKEQKALEIAKFIRKHYNRIEKIKEIKIVFGVYKTYTFYKDSNELDTYDFKVSEIN